MPAEGEEIFSTTSLPYLKLYRLLIIDTMHFQYTTFCTLAFTLLPLTSGDGIDVQFGHGPELDDASNPSISKLKARDFKPLFFDDPGADNKPSPNDAKLAQRGIEVQFAHDPALDEPHPSDSKIGSRDLQPLFWDDPGADGKSNFAGSKLANRDIEVQFGHDPELDEPPASNSEILTRDFKPLFADDPGSGGNPAPERRISSRQVEVQFGEDESLNDVSSSATPANLPRGFDLSNMDKSAMDRLLQSDERCAARVQINKKWERSVDEIDKRVDPFDPRRQNPADIMFDNPNVSNHHPGCRGISAMGPT